MEKFELLYTVLSAFHNSGILKEIVLVGSWCQDFYRDLFGNPFQIPAATTTDADLLIPKKLKFRKHISVSSIMEDCGFKIVLEGSSGLMRFIHEDFKVEFLTEAGAKAEEKIHTFKNLDLSTQELHFMSIPLDYNFTMHFRDITFRLPEPEAFALHKLIISQRRENPIKKEKDINTARGLLEYFETKKKHQIRIKEIYEEFPKGWQKKINEALKSTGLGLPG